MKAFRRNLSGIYIFDQLEGDGKQYPTCLEECTKEKRTEWLNGLEKEALISTVEHLCDILRGIGNQFDIMAE